MTGNFTDLIPSDLLDATTFNTVLQELSDAIDDQGDGSTALSAPAITSFTNATHDHEDAAGGGQLTADAIDSEAATNGKVLTADGVSGASWQTPPTTILTTKGDLATHTGAAAVRFGVGSDGFPLVADSAQTEGMKWGGMKATGMEHTGVQVYHSANQAVGIGSTVTLNWDSENFDTNTFHDLVTNNSRLTIPASHAGRYRVYVRLSDLVSGSTYGFIIHLKKNGSDIYVHKTADANTGSDHTHSSYFSIVLELAVSDYLEIDAENTDAAVASSFAGTGSGKGCYFGLEYIGTT